MHTKILGLNMKNQTVIIKKVFGVYIITQKRLKFKYFKCHFCAKAYKTSHYLKAHIKKCENKFNCFYCEKQTKDISDIKKHLIFHTHLVKCNTCGFLIKQKDIYKHEMIHEKSYPLFLCCDLNFESKFDLTLHRQSHQNTNTPKTCKITKNLNTSKALCKKYLGKNGFNSL